LPISSSASAPSPAAISIDGLGKRYRLGTGGGGAFTYQTLRDSLANAARSWVGAVTRGDRRAEPEFIWALQNVSVTIGRGEVVGIVGRNGAGKSTLLKILSRITRPTCGEALLNGRVGSLLEVGTGFHPELTGRENIFLNGAILGMRRHDLLRKFDAIVDFSGISRFIDTPVKRYSSGMYVRLAFAVAAHLETEILLVDEVLAVGDAAFQRQCLGKMQDISGSGRTILFVSHNMQAITRLCTRALLIAQGQLVEDGPAAQIVARYLTSEVGTTAMREWPDGNAAPGNERVRLRRVRVVDRSGAPVESVDVRHDVGVEISFDVLAAGDPFVPGISLMNDQGQPIFSAMDTDPRWRAPLSSGRYSATAWIPGNLLNEGTIIVSVSLGTHSPGGRMVRQAHVNEVVAFHVYDAGEGGTARGDYHGVWLAPVRPLLQWSLDRDRSEHVTSGIAAESRTV
jgi:lipopolysaccharide transport system ATP-binding protein